VGNREQGGGWRQEEWLWTGTEKHEDFLAERRQEGRRSFGQAFQIFSLRGRSQRSGDPAPKSRWESESEVEPQELQQNPEPFELSPEEHRRQPQTKEHQPLTLRGAPQEIQSRGTPL
jgi:hypothetical protein